MGAPGEDGGLKLRAAGVGLHWSLGALSTDPGDDGGSQHQAEVHTG